MEENQIKMSIACLFKSLDHILKRSDSFRNNVSFTEILKKRKIGFKDMINEDIDTICDSEQILNIVNISHEIVSSIEKESKDSKSKESGRSLRSVFNILNNNNETYTYMYSNSILNKESVFPTEKDELISSSQYDDIIENIVEKVKKIDLSIRGFNNLLKTYEDFLSYVPFSTYSASLSDISVYDHCKMTVAVANSIFLYMKYNKNENYLSDLNDRNLDLYNEKSFLLYSMDISGIQKFIYTISSKGALKNLRARSFYLEMLMEIVIDELLDKAELPRTNLIYSGGGHCYMILPNTDNMKASIDDFEKELNKWFLHNFDTDLYIAGGFSECSANMLSNKPEGAYSKLFIEMSTKISKKKSCRYSSREIIHLNNREKKDGRECVICKRVDDFKGKNNSGEKLCETCYQLTEFSNKILKNSVYAVIKEQNLEKYPGIKLPFGKYICPVENIEEFQKYEDAIRYYVKNDKNRTYDFATNLWVGDYHKENEAGFAYTFDDYEDKSIGIDRIAVLRADVDNLGTTFVSGFKNNGSEKDNTISRTSVLSRQLSLFFKGYINQILRKPIDNTFGISNERNVAIVYSGGDDVFIVGSWNDVISSAIDLRNALKKFTQGTLTISGGIGLYKSGYPINIMAKEVEHLEDFSKEIEGKDAITIFDDTGRYKWNEFIDEVIGEKYNVIKEFFDLSEDRGKNFMYNLLEYLKNTEERINFARYVYLLARMEPDRKDKEKTERYRIFSEKMYNWIKNENDRRQVITAIYLYVYATREKEDK